MIEISVHMYHKFILFFLILIESSMTYKILSLDDHKLCSPITKREIKLGTDSSSALIVSLGNLRRHSVEWDSNFICKFQVHSSNTNYGIFVVIQNIVFRKNETTDECIDYVQYKRRDGSTSRQYCGRFNAALAMDRIFAPDAYTSSLTPTSNSFVVPVGKVDVTIYISKMNLKVYEEMDLEITFTSFRMCYMGFENDVPCNQKHKDRCIFKGFLNDNYINCPYPDCVDENGCAEKIVHEKMHVKNKLVIGSFTVLLVMFLFFICFLWLCRKYKKLCWSEEFASPNNTSRTSRTIEANDPPLRDIAMPGSTRTSISVQNVILEEEDKDLPPSYDSLFPVR